MIAQLEREREQFIRNREYYVQRLKKGLITADDYKHLIQMMTSGKTDAEYLTDLNQKIARERKQEKSFFHHHKTAMVLIALVVFLGLFAVLFKGNITGLVTYGEEQNTTINSNFSTGTYVFDLQNITGLSITGKVYGETAKIYAIKEGKKYLIYQKEKDSNLITGNVVEEIIARDLENNTLENITAQPIDDQENITQEANVTINETALNETIPDGEINQTIPENISENMTDNETINNTIGITVNETINITIDEPINTTLNATFNETINETVPLNQTTIENITINESVNESIDINLTENETVDIINDTTNITVNINVTTNITINTTANTTANITANQTINNTFNATANATINITVNQTENITLNASENETNIAYQITPFTHACVETCSLPLNTIILEIETDGFIEIEQLHYTQENITEDANITAFKEKFDKAIVIKDIKLKKQILGLGEQGYDISIESLDNQTTATLEPENIDSVQHIKIISKNEKTLSDIFAVTPTNGKATIQLAKIGLAKGILQCELFNFEADTCNNWIATEIAFNDYGNYAEFTVNALGVYAIEIESGKVELNVLQEIAKKGSARIIVVPEKPAVNDVQKVLEAEKTADIVQTGTIQNNNIIDLENDPAVARVVLDQQVNVLLHEAIPLINGNVSTYGFTVNGSGINICIVDTGIDSSLIPVTAEYNFLTNDSNAEDDNGHGTQIANVMYAIAPASALYSAKVIDSSGQGYESNVLRGLQWCMDNGVDIISLSIGAGSYDGFCDSNIVAEKVNDAVAQGIVVIAATGNDYGSNLKAPSCAINATRVSATDKSDVIADFANVNLITDIFAPGKDITTKTIGNNDITVSGTSISVPFVTAGTALLLEQETLAPSDVKYRLRSTGKPIAYTQDNIIINISRIDIYNLLTNNVTNIPYDYFNTSQSNQTEQNQTYTISTVPTHSTPLIEPLEPGDNQSFVCYNQSTSDAEGDAVTNIYNWRINNTPIMLLNLPFDTNVSGHGSSVKDYSGYGNNGTLNGTTIYTMGKIGGGYHFNKSRSNYINVTKASLLLVENFTMTFWYYIDETVSITHTPYFVNKGTGTLGIRIGSVNGLPGMRTELDAEDLEGSISSTVNNMWYMYALACNATSCSTYINGTFDVQSAGKPTNLQTYDLTIGVGATSAVNRLNGTMDEFKIFNRTLTADQILQIYNDELNNRTNRTIVMNETFPSDNWTCEITPNDKSGDGITRNVSTVIQVNTTPTHTTPTLSTSVPTFSANFTCYNQSTTAYDGKTASNVYNWLVDNVSITVLNLPLDHNISSTASGALKDYSGYNNNGTLAGTAPVWASNGKVGGGYNFSGDRITVTDHTSLDTTTAFTVEVWAFPSTVSSPHDIIGKYAWSDGQGLFQVRQFNAELRAYLIEGTTIQIVNATSFFTINTWHHIVVVYNSSNITIYKNGVWAANYDPTLSFLPTNTNVVIGAAADTGTANYFSGVIDHVKIYNRSLSGNQIAQLYAETSAGKTDNSTITDLETVDSGTHEWVCEVTPLDYQRAGMTKNVTATTSPDTTAPTCSISVIDETSNFAFVSGNRVYYTNKSSGSFTVTVSASDAQSSIDTVTFPSTVDNGGGDRDAAYSWQYNWTTADNANYTNANITVNDSNGNVGSCLFNVTFDYVAPSGGSINYSNSVINFKSHLINVSVGLDDLSGISEGNATAWIYRQNASYSQSTFTCGSYGAFERISDNTTTKSQVNDSTLTYFYCYKYIYTVTDNVNNSVNYTSSNVVVVDPCSRTTGDWFVNETLVCENRTGSNKISIPSNTLTVGINGTLSFMNVHFEINHTIIKGNFTYKHSKNDVSSTASQMWAYGDTNITGKLVLENVSMYNNDFNQNYGITVNGTMIINSSSNVTTYDGDSTQFIFQVYNGSTFIAKDSALSYMGKSPAGLWINASSQLINNTINEELTTGSNYVQIYSKHNIIENNTFYGSNNAQLLLQLNFVSNTTLKNNTLQSKIGSDMVSLTNSENNTITGNLFWNKHFNSFNNEELALSIASSSSGNNITNNKFYGGGLGIAVQGTNMRIVNNTFVNVSSDSDTAEYGYGAVYGNSGSLVLENNTVNSSYRGFLIMLNNTKVISNNFFNISNVAIFVSSVNNTNITNNLLENNSNGIFVYNASFTFVENNTLKNNTIAGINVSDTTAVNIIQKNIITKTTHAIHLKQANHTNITNNTLENNTQGIVILGYTNFTSILYNTILNNTKAGINISVNATNNTIQYNNIHNNSDANVVYAFANTQSLNVSALYQWWGTTNETIIEQYLLHSVDSSSYGTISYCPYLISAYPDGAIAEAETSQCMCTAAFSYRGGNVYFNATAFEAQSQINASCCGNQYAENIFSRVCISGCTSSSSDIACCDALNNEITPYTSQGTVLIYHFSEGTGTTTADNSGYNNTGTITKGLWNEGKFGSGLNVSNNSYVTRADAGSYGLNITNSITLEAWVKLDKLPTAASYFAVIDKKSGTAGYSLDITNETYNYSARIYLLNTGTSIKVNSTTNVTTGTWYYLAGVFNGTVTRLYVNGVLESEMNQTATIGTTTNSLRIAADATPANYFNGTVDEVRISNYAKSEREISDEYRRRNQLLVCHFNNGTGTTINLPANTTYNGDGTYTTTYQPGPDDGKDNYLWAAFTDTNYGTSSSLLVYKNFDSNALVEFNITDIMNINSSISVVNATFFVYKFDSNSGSRNSKVWRIAKNWSEATSSWTNASAGDPWSTAGGDMGSAEYDSISSTAPVWDPFNVTNLTKEWINGTYANYGFLIKGGGLTTDDQTFYSSDYPTDATLRPKLTITYTLNNANISCEDGEMPTVSVFLNQSGKIKEGVLFNISSMHRLKFNTTNNYNNTVGTVMFWIKPSWNGYDNGQYYLFVADNSTSNYGNRRELFKASNNSLILRVYNATGNDTNVTYDVSGWAANTWYFVAASWNQSNMSLYINETMVASTNTAEVPTGTGTYFYIGNRENLSQPANATFDELAIYQDVFSSSEMSDFYSKATNNVYDAVCYNGLTCIAGNTSLISTASGIANRDDSQVYCEAGNSYSCTNYSWLSNLASPICCGDDTSENTITRTCDGTSYCTTDTTDRACCTSTDQCVYNGVCHATNTHNYTGANTSYCVNGQWTAPLPPIIINATDNTSNGVIGPGHTVNFSIFWSPQTNNANASILILRNMSTDQCNYVNRSACMCSQNVTVGDPTIYQNGSCTYSVQPSDGSSITWYPRICNSNNQCTSIFISDYWFNDTVNNKAYRGNTTNETPPNASFSGLEFNETAYTNINLSDNVRASVSLSVNEGVMGYNVMDFRFKINENVSDIGSIQIHFEGYSTEGTGGLPPGAAPENSDDMSIVLHNITANNLTSNLQTACSQATGCRNIDYQMDYNITSDFDDFVNSTNHLRFLAYEYDDNYKPPAQTCPYLYVWNGTDYQFILDVGFGMLGRGLSVSETTNFSAPLPYNRDYVLIQGAALVNENNSYHLKISEELNEITYLDSVAVYAIDHAKDIAVYPDFRTTGIVYTVNKTLQEPLACQDALGIDCREKIKSLDAAAWNQTEDNRFIMFELPAMDSAKEQKLVIRNSYHREREDAEIAYPYPPVLEFLKNNEWTAFGNIDNIEESYNLQIPKMKTTVINITGINSSVVRIRYPEGDVLGTVDFIGVDNTNQQNIVKTKLTMKRAELKINEYSAAHPGITGNLTRLGDVFNLIHKADDTFVIMNRGDYVDFTFDALEENQDTERDFILAGVSYYKQDQNPYGKNILPLPFANMSSYPYNQSLEQHPNMSFYREYNSRPETRHNSLYADRVNITVISRMGILSLDTTPPACNIKTIQFSRNYSFYNITAGTYSIYYNNKSSGHFNVSINSSDNIGMSAITLFPNTTTWGGYNYNTTYTTGINWTYNFSTANNTNHTAALVYVFDSVNNQANCSFNVYVDYLPPSGGSINITTAKNQTIYTQPVGLSLSAGTDDLSGINPSYAVKKIYRRNGTYSNPTTCTDSWSAWSVINETTETITSYNDNNLSPESCYNYQFEVSDNVYNTINYTNPDWAYYAGCPSSIADWTISAGQTQICENMTMVVSNSLILENIGMLILRNVTLYVNNTDNRGILHIENESVIWIRTNFSIGGNPEDPELPSYEDGWLYVNKSTLRMNGTFDGESNIVIRAATGYGEVKITNSNITNGDNPAANYGFYTLSLSLLGSFKMENSTVSHAGWSNTYRQRGLEFSTYSAGAPIVINGNNFTNNYIAIAIFNDLYGAFIENNTFTNNTAGVFLGTSASKGVNLKNNLFLNTNGSVLGAIYINRLNHNLTNITIKNTGNYSIIFSNNAENVTLRNVLLQNNTYGLYLNGSRLIRISNSTINESLYADIAFNGVERSNLTAENTTFRKDNVSFSSCTDLQDECFLDVYWYANVKVNTTFDAGLTGANVSIANLQGTTNFNQPTDSNGYTNTSIIREYWNNGTWILNATPHVFNASYPPYPNQSKSVIVNQSLVYNFTMQSLPSYSAVVITPTPVVVQQVMSCYANFIDLEQTLINVSFIWFRNGTQNNSWNATVEGSNATNIYTTLNITGTNLSLGDNWTCSARAHDGFNYTDWYNSTTITVQNGVPSIVNVAITPTTPNHADNLNCSVNVSDTDLLVNVSYIWYFNGTQTNNYNTTVEANPANLIYTNFTVPASAVNLSDNWTCSARACDATGCSNWTNSSTVTIINNPPNSVTLFKPTNGNTTIHERNTTFEWVNTTDTEGDSLTYQINVTTADSVDCTGTSFNVTGISANTTVSPQELCVRTEMGSVNYYNWSVRACDQWNCSAWANVWNFSIEPWVVITFINDSINFGTLTIDQTEDTEDGSPTPFILRNDGNVKSDLVNVSANQSLWTTEALGTNYTQIKAANRTEPGSINGTGSLINWTNLTAANQSIIYQLNYNDSRDTADIDVKVTVPTFEPAGNKITSLIFYWEQTW
ncbi:hypothetical protein C4573_04070 [Candidatus Woesearchaeota archaeon]|nr:MAG: hypothetical protein C4573_04070 [Candidatus Woesearchaeota archaeon]